MIVALRRSAVAAVAAVCLAAAVAAGGVARAFDLDCCIPATVGKGVTFIGTVTATTLVTTGPSLLAPADGSQWSIQGAGNFAGCASITFDSANSTLGAHTQEGDVLYSQNVDLVFGPLNDANSAQCRWSTAQTQDALVCGVDETSRSWHFADAGDTEFNFAAAAQSTPTVYFHSQNQSTTQYVSVTHNSTDGVLTSGAGGIQLLAADSSVVTLGIGGAVDTVTIDEARSSGGLGGVNTIQAAGTAQPTRVRHVPITAMRSDTGATAASTNGWPTLTFTDAALGTDIVTFTAFNDSCVAGTITIFAVWTGTSAPGGGAETVQWVLDYKAIGDNGDTSTGFSAPVTTADDLTAASQEERVQVLSIAGAGPGAHFLVRIQRDNSGADDYAASAFLMDGYQTFPSACP